MVVLEQFLLQGVRACGTLFRPGVSHCVSWTVEQPQEMQHLVVRSNLFGFTFR